MIVNAEQEMIAVRLAEINIEIYLKFIWIILLRERLSKLIYIFQIICLWK